MTAPAALQVILDDHGQPVIVTPIPPLVGVHLSILGSTRMREWVVLDGLDDLLICGERFTILGYSGRVHGLVIAHRGDGPAPVYAPDGWADATLDDDPDDGPDE